MPAIYKILPLSLWDEAKRTGIFHGSEVDLRDGYIHFSTAEQVEALGESLKWEPSRGGALFPHLYAPLDVSLVLRAHPLPLAEHGRHIFPPL